MLNKAALDALVALTICALIFAAGWMVRGWKEDSSRLTEERAASAALLASMAAFDAAANSTLSALVQAKKDQATNKREIVRVLTKVEYRDRECLGADLVGLLNQAAAGGGAGGVAGEVPAGPPTAP